MAIGVGVGALFCLLQDEEQKRDSGGLQLQDWHFHPQPSLAPSLTQPGDACRLQYGGTTAFPKHCSPPCWVPSLPGLLAETSLGLLESR